MHYRRISSMMAFISAFLLSGGCDQLVYVHNAAFGIDVTASTEGTARMMLGYDAETFAIVPRFDSKEDSDPPEAMSLVSVSNVEAKGLDEIVFNHFIATGAAANDAATDTDGLRMMRDAVYGNTDSTVSQKGDNP